MPLIYFNTYLDKDSLLADYTNTIEKLSTELKTFKDINLKCKQIVDEVRQQNTSLSEELSNSKSELEREKHNLYISSKELQTVINDLNRYKGNYIYMLIYTC